MPSCYLCGSPGSLPLALKDSFTAHSLARCTESNCLCDRCVWALDSRFWYLNPSKGSWSALYARGFSTLWVQGALQCPELGPQRTERAGKQGSFTLPTVSALPTRAQIRGWLLDPPDPPFTIAIAESGQKHIIPWAQTAHDRDYFPVQFEMDCLWINRLEFSRLIDSYESLMALGFSKTEIDSGDYHSDRMMSAIVSATDWQDNERVVSPYRGSRLLQLGSHVAQRPAEAGDPSEMPI